MTNLITVEYETIEGFARQFADEAARFERSLQQIRQQHEVLYRQAWVGDNANTFYKTMQTDILPALQRLTQALYEADHVTRAMAVVYQEAEQQGKAAFNGTDAGGNGSGSGRSSYMQLSSNADGGLNGAPPDVKQVIFVNGVQNSAEDHRASIQNLQNVLGKPVMGIYNATDGKFDNALDIAKDHLAQNLTMEGIWNRITNPIDALSSDLAALGRMGAGIGDGVEVVNDWTDASLGIRLDGGNPAVDQLVTQIKNHQGSLEIVVHSQGSAITAAALNRLERQGFNMSHITVTTLGGAGVDFPNGQRAPQYHHIAHDSDIVTTPNRYINHDDSDITVYSDRGNNLLENHSLDGYMKTLKDYRTQHNL
jgi:WXG100 family type VII secretion target